MKKLIAIVLSIGIMGSLSGCGLISKTPEGIAATVVAKVNDQRITRAEFDKRFASYLEQMKLFYGKEGVEEVVKDAEQLKGIKAQFLDGLVEEAILLQKAKELKVAGDDKALAEEVEKKYKEDVESYKGEEELKKYLDNTKTTVEEYKEIIKNSVLVSKLQESVVKDVTVSDETAKKHFDDNRYLYTEKPSKMNISHIIVEKEDDIKKAKERLDKGEKFEDVAKEVNLDGTKDKGGSLGDVDYANNNLDKSFFIQAVAVPAGKISSPFKTEYGWHIVKVNSKEEYPVKAFEAVKEEIKTKLLSDTKQEAYDKKVEEWKDAAKIKTYEDRL